MQKPVIHYPCDWFYKVIGYNEAIITKEIEASLESVRYSLYESNKSKHGKYISINVQVQVQNETERLRVFEILKNIPSVKMVL